MLGLLDLLCFAWFGQSALGSMLCCLYWLGCLFCFGLCCFAWLCLFTLLCFACLLALIALRALICFASWTPETQPNDALRRRLVEFLMFNLLALAWVEQGFLLDSLGLVLLRLALLAWFAWFSYLFCFRLLWFICFSYFALFAWLCLAYLFCQTKICEAWLVVLLALAWLELARLGHRFFFISFWSFYQIITFASSVQYWESHTCRVANIYNNFKNRDWTSSTVDEAGKREWGSDVWCQYWEQ